MSGASRSYGLLDVRAFENHRSHSAAVQAAIRDGALKAEERGWLLDRLRYPVNLDIGN